jgi:hypothetical protein
VGCDRRQVSGSRRRCECRAQRKVAEECDPWLGAMKYLLEALTLTCGVVDRPWCTSDSRCPPGLRHHHL